MIYNIDPKSKDRIFAFYSDIPVSVECHFEESLEKFLEYIKELSDYYKNTEVSYFVPEVEYRGYDGAYSFILKHYIRESDKEYADRLDTLTQKEERDRKAKEKKYRDEIARYKKLLKAVTSE